MPDYTKQEGQFFDALNDIANTQAIYHLGGSRSREQSVIKAPARNAAPVDSSL